MIHGGRGALRLGGDLWWKCRLRVTENAAHEGFLSTAARSGQVQMSRGAQCTGHRPVTATPPVHRVCWGGLHTPAGPKETNTVTWCQPSGTSWSTSTKCSVLWEGHVSNHRQSI